MYLFIKKILFIILMILVSATISHAEDQLLLTVASDAQPDEIAYYYTVTDARGGITAVKYLRFYTSFDKYETKIIDIKSGNKSATSNFTEIVLNQKNGLDVVVLQMINFNPETGGLLRLKYLNDATNIFSDKYKYIDMEILRYGDSWKIFCRNKVNLSAQNISSGNTGVVETIFFKKRISSFLGTIGIKDVIINNPIPGNLYKKNLNS